MASWQRIVGRLVVQILLFFLLICAPEAALADFSGNHSPGGVPAGIKSYSVTGAFLDNHGPDKNYSTVNLEGLLAPSGVLRFSGIAIRQPQGKGFESTASLKVELVMEHSPPVTFVKNLGISTHSVPFEVSAPIVPGKRAYIYLKFSGGPSVRPFSLRMNFSFAPAAAAADPKQEWVRPVGNPPPDSIGWMDGIEGTGSADIQIKKNIDGNIAEQPWRQIVPGEKIWLYSGTQIQTKNGCEARIMFNTGARIRLKPNTRFEMGDIQSQRPRATEVIGRLWNGLGNFFFPKTAGGERKFEIEGSRAIVGIKGTTLNIKDIGSATTVQVLEGSVTVRNKASHDSQVVTAGQTITVANSASTSTTGSGRIFDASFSRSNGTAYFIKGNQYIRFNTRAHRAEPGFPKTITSETWPGLPWTRIDAIVGWKTVICSFFMELNMPDTIRKPKKFCRDIRETSTPRLGEDFPGIRSMPPSHGIMERFIFSAVKSMFDMISTITKSIPGIQNQSIPGIGPGFRGIGSMPPSLGTTRRFTFFETVNLCATMSKITVSIPGIHSP